MHEPTVIKVDNRYRDGKIVRRGKVLVGNKQTTQITEVPNPSNPLQPILMVSETLARHLSAPRESKGLKQRR